MNKRSTLIAAGLTALGAVAGFGLKSVLADGIPSPNPLYYSGTLTEGTAPANGTRAITINLWSDSTATATQLCQTAASPTVVNGRFRVQLNSQCKSAINANPNATVEVLDNGLSLGGKAAIGAVPYAVEADHAVNATNAVDGGGIASALAVLAPKTSIPIIMDWQSYDGTLTAGGTTVDPTYAQTNAAYRRVGDTVEIHVEMVLQANVPQNLTGGLDWSLPTGVVWDSQKGTRGTRGIAEVSTGVGDNHTCYANVTGDGSQLYGYCNSDAVVSSTVIRVGYPSAWAAGTDFALDLRFPVKGWTATATQ